MNCLKFYLGLETNEPFNGKSSINSTKMYSFLVKSKIKEIDENVKICFYIIYLKPNSYEKVSKKLETRWDIRNQGEIFDSNSSLLKKIKEMQLYIKLDKVVKV
jgi:hypothetical protein